MQNVVMNLEYDLFIILQKLDQIGKGGKLKNPDNQGLTV